MTMAFIAACSPSAGNPTGSPVNGNGAPVTGEGICANPYYPVREGATWTYESTGSPSGTYSFTDTITSVRSDGFTLTSEFDDRTRTQEWACKGEGLSALKLGGPMVATLNSQDLNFVLNVKNASGVTYPTIINIGDQWQQTLEFDGAMDISGETATAEGNVQTTFTAVGNESVTVPAGTFDAIKLQVDSALNISMTIQALTVPVTYSGAYFYWYAEGVGWVKASGEGNVTSVSFTETIELQSYNIP